MSLAFDLSPFQIQKKGEKFVSSSLKKFSESPLSEISEKDLQTAKKTWRDITKSHSHILMFAFGGTASTEKILSSLYPRKFKNVFLIDDIDEKTLNKLSAFKKAELQSAHSLFFSNSGKTEEILFYMSFLKKIYKKAKLSLKRKMTVISQSEHNPLVEWGKKEGGVFLLSESPLPGRFSFFNLNGLLQSQAYIPHFKMEGISAQIEKALLFFFCCRKKKEIYLCRLSAELKALSRWLELSWSESLFKKGGSTAPILRNMSLSDLRHGFIQELLTKKNQALFWGLNIKNKEKTKALSANPIKELLQKHNIPYLFINLSLDKQSSFSGLMRALYQILFLMAEISKVNIYTQVWVDHLKKPKGGDGPGASPLIHKSRLII